MSEWQQHNATHGTRYLVFEDDATIADVFQLRCRTSPNAAAYREYDGSAWRGVSWQQIGDLAMRACAGLRRDGLLPGERIAIMLKNSVNWVMFDQAAYAHGMVPVPLFVDDRPDNVAYILNDADVKVIVIDGEEHWKRLKTVRDQLVSLQRIICVKPVNDADEPRLISLNDWLPVVAGEYRKPSSTGHDLATIVYTSGTTGKPKGVMLSHRNMLANVQSGLAVYTVYPSDVFLSFLPLSHMFERTCDYYLNVVSGASMVFSRSIAMLAEQQRCTGCDVSRATRGRDACAFNADMTASGTSARALAAPSPINGGLAAFNRWCSSGKICLRRCANRLRVGFFSRTQKKPHHR